MAKVGPLGEGPGHFALGRGYLALQRHDEALDHLERAVGSGYRTPTVDYNLGLVLGKLYERHLQRAQLIENEDQRAAYRREIETRYKEPALAHLRRSASPRLESAAYAEGLIAFYEQRYEEALAKAKDAIEELEWLYEAKILEGDIHLALGAEKKFRGAYDGALFDFSLAGAAYETAAELARSDASVYDGDCARWIQVVETEARRGAPERSTFDSALGACTRSLDSSADQRGGSRARLLEKDPDYAANLAALIAMAIRDGIPPRRSMATDPHLASDEALFAEPRPLAVPGTFKEGLWSAHGFLGVIGSLGHSNLDLMVCAVIVSHMQ